MTIPGRTYDGWPIHPKYYDQMEKKKKISVTNVKTWEGRELAIVIRQSLADRGVVISDERYELIAKACEKEI